MRRNPSSRVWPVAVVVLLGFAGCSSGGDPTSLGPVPTGSSTVVAETTTTAGPAPTTTVGAATSSTAARPTTTRAPAAPTTSTTAAPVVVDGIPQLTSTPARGPVGTRVMVEGTGFTDEMWRGAGAGLWLVAPTGCGAYAAAQHTVTVSPSGRLSGEFVVPRTGECRQSTVGDVPLTPGVHRIAFACTACTVGRFEVTTA